MFCKHTGKRVQMKQISIALFAVVLFGTCLLVTGQEIPVNQALNMRFTEYFQSDHSSNRVVNALKIRQLQEQMTYTNWRAEVVSTYRNIDMSNSLWSAKGNERECQAIFGQRFQANPNELQQAWNDDAFNTDLPVSWRVLLIQESPAIVMRLDESIQSSGRSKKVEENRSQKVLSDLGRLAHDDQNYRVRTESARAVEVLLREAHETMSSTSIEDITSTLLGATDGIINKARCEARNLNDLESECLVANLNALSRSLQMSLVDGNDIRNHLL